MSELTPEDALRQAAGLTSHAVKQAEARCGVLAQFVGNCDSAGSRSAAWSDALRELSAQQGYRRGLVRRLSLIRQALESPVDERPATMALRQPERSASRTQQQVQIRARRRAT